MMFLSAGMMIVDSVRVMSLFSAMVNAFLVGALLIASLSSASLLTILSGSDAQLTVEIKQEKNRPIVNSALTAL
ncbi:hypothetical protein [Candidatus Bathycorpusculum sp.]|uniref:hypothetical protein n=1 Tax=Candidatus Bathycorpusculum sp. TaxID=2994959 RepID=UPI00282729A5|nr:hypothetical protein [Candidatus Termitimicrobium sp.]MCL2686570.1 hypothetical protein [Candidatus Termitimicrobium sp.]